MEASDGTIYAGTGPEGVLLIDIERPIIPRQSIIYIDPPEHVIGKNTVEALQSGIIFGFAGQVEGIATRMRRELAPGGPGSVTVIATGGLAPLVLDEISVIDAHEPWLTLIGLRLVYERNTTGAQ